MNKNLKKESKIQGKKRLEEIIEEERKNRQKEE